MKEDLKKVLFIKTFAALEAYTAAAAARLASEETSRRHERFRALWDIIQESGLEDEFEAWKEG